MTSIEQGANPYIYELDTCEYTRLIPPPGASTEALAQSDS